MTKRLEIDMWLNDPGSGEMNRFVIAIEEGMTMDEILEASGLKKLGVENIHENKGSQIPMDYVILNNDKIKDWDAVKKAVYSIHVDTKLFPKYKLSKSLHPSPQEE